MAVVSTLLSLLSIGGGLTGSFVWDTPSGPSIVLMAGALFLLAYLSYALKRAYSHRVGRAENSHNK
jgi:zinc transport system permease protein